MNSLSAAATANKFARVSCWVPFYLFTAPNEVVKPLMYIVRADHSHRKACHRPFAAAMCGASAVAQIS